MSLARNGRKEQHFFRRAIQHGWSSDQAQSYAALFADSAGAYPGEFTPGYLRLPWVAPLLKGACDPDPLLIVALRDPIERFYSAMRWTEGRPERQERSGRVIEPHTPRSRMVDSEQATWAGCYATQLRLWARVFDSSRFLVLQYEAITADPQRALDAIWARLGLEPVDLTDPGAESRTATSDPRAPGDAIPGFADQMRALYEPEVAALESDWEIDRSLWPNFA